MKKLIIFVDNSLKRVIQVFLKKENKELPVRIPTKGGGWNAVVGSVEELNKLNINAIGILDGDTVKETVKIATDKGIKNRIFITEKRETEKYFYDKGEIRSTLPEEAKILSFHDFKKWLKDN